MRVVVLLVLVHVHVADAFGPRPRPRLYGKPSVPRHLLEAELALRELAPGGAAAAGLLADGVWGSIAGESASTTPRFEEYALRGDSRDAHERTFRSDVSNSVSAQDEEYTVEMNGEIDGGITGIVPADSLDSMRASRTGQSRAGVSDAVELRALSTRENALAALEREREALSPSEEMFAMLRREGEHFVNPRTGKPFVWGDTWMHSRGGGVGTGRPESRPRRITKDGVVEVMPAKNDDGYKLVPVSSDKRGLVEFYEKCNGPRWSNTRNWGVGEPCANAWHGVLCVGGRVTELILNLNNVACMGSLDFAALADHVRELRYIDLSDNLFSGSLPKDLFRMTQLQSLVLSGNRITGTLSEDFANLQELRHLDLSANAMHGPLPNSLGTLGKLEVLYLGESGLENKNDFVGPIPESWRGLKSLKYFSLAGNANVGGTLADWLLNSLESLHELTLSRCGLTGEIPRNINQLNSLRLLDLSGNMLRGHVPFDSFTRHLKDLRLANNELEGTLTSAIGNLREIERLDVSSNNLSGELPVELFGGLGALEILDVSNNRFTGTLQASTSPDASELRIINAENNRLSGALLCADFFRHAPHLRFLKLSNNEISGSFADDTFEAAGELVELHLSRNNFAGPLPRSLGSMKKLKSLRLNDNPRLGTHGIAESLSECIDLRILDVSRSGFEGMIPETLFERMSRLVHVNLSGNLFTGELPPSLAAPKFLRKLELQDNGFYGEIPEWLIRRDHLELVDFTRNSFTGALPSAFYSASTQSIPTLPGYGNRPAGVPRRFKFGRNPFFCPLPNWARVLTAATCREATIVSIEPTASKGGDVLTIVGSGFHRAQINVGCMFGNEVEHVFVRSMRSNDTHVSCVVPSLHSLPGGARRKNNAAGLAVSVRVGTESAAMTLGELFIYEGVS